MSDHAEAILRHFDVAFERIVGVKMPEYRPDDDQDQEAAQHADTLAMQKQVLDDLFVLYEYASRYVGLADDLDDGLSDRAANIAAALGLSNEWGKKTKDD